MSKFKENELKEIINDINEDIRWYGWYQGRGSSKGYAFKIVDHGDLLAVGARLSEEGGYDKLLKGFCNIDNLGDNIIVTWHHSLFEDPEVEAEPAKELSFEEWIADEYGIRDITHISPARAEDLHECYSERLL
jgi:hypothetical protein